MALEIRDRVKETCTGTDGDMTLTGAMSGFVGFDLDATLDGDTIYYALEDADGTKWEVGLGTLSADSTTIARTEILATQVSFTDTTRQTFSGGTHTIFATYPASKAVYLDASGNLSHTVDISSDTNLAAGTGITLTGDTLSTTDGEIVHDNLSGFVANEHIDWTTDQGATNIHSNNYVVGISVLSDLNDVVSPSDGSANNTILIATNGSTPSHGTLSGNAAGNIGLGTDCLGSLTTGDYNVAIGYKTLESLTSDGYNVAIGSHVMANATSERNVGIGFRAMFETTTADYCTIVGHEAGYYHTTGNGNTAIGHFALYGNPTNKVTGSDNVAVGKYALYQISSGSHNVGVGDMACGAGGTSGFTGSDNIGIGQGAGYSYLAGESNICMGYYAGFSSIDNGDYNIAIGHRALADKTSPSDMQENIAIGYEAGQLSDANRCIYIGTQEVGYANTTDDILFIGNDAPLSDGTLIKADLENKHLAIGMADDHFVNSAGSPTLQVYPNDAADEAIFVKMPTSHSSNLIQIQNSSGTDLFVVDSTGEITTGSISGGGGSGDMTGVDLTGGVGISIDSETNTTSGAYSSTITCNLEGTELASTGETGTTKFLRVDGDGTCSWQVPPDTDTTYTKASFDIDHLFTLVGASDDADEHLGTFTGSTIADNQTIKAAIQAVETAVETKGATAGSSSIVTVGTISSGTWQGTAIAQAYIANDAINGDKIADDAVNSEHYAAGSIDEEHLNATNSPTDNYLLSYDDASGGFTWVAAGSGGENNEYSFKTISVSGQDDVVADTTTDTLTLAAGSNVTITTTAASDTVTIAATDTNTTYSAATSSALGLVKIEDDTEQSVAANAVSATASRTYGIQLNSSDQAVVNVPWTDTDNNTTYTGGTNLTLDGTTFNVDDAFLKNDASDSTTGTITAGGFTTAGTLTVDSVGISTIQSSGESFADNDTSLMTSAAIDDRINSAVANEDTLAELNDTNISSAAAGHLIIYDNTASVWDNAALTAGSNISITNDDGAITIAATDTNTTYTGGTNLTLAGTTFNVDDAFLINSGDDTTTGVITAGGFTTTGTWTFDEFTSGTVGITTVQDSGTTFDDNDTSLMTAAAIADKIEAYGYSTTAGDITGVTAGTGLSGGGASGAVTLNVDASQTQITAVGTIGTGVWQGTAIAHAYIGADAIDGDNIADDSVNSEHYVDGSIDTAHIGDDQVTYAKIQNVSSTDRILGRDSAGAGVIEEITPANLRTMINVEDGATADQTKSDIDGLAITTVGTIDTGTWQGTAIAHAYIGNDAIDGDNIADDAINSEHYVDGSIDTAHIADDQVTYAKVQNVSATSRVLGRITSGAGVIEELTGANIRTIANVEDGATADQTKSDIDGLAITTVGTIDTGVWQGTAIAHAYIGADAIDGDNIADDAVNSEHYVDGSIDTAHIADDQVTYAKIQNVSATDRILGRDSAGAGVIEEITPANLRTMLNVEDGATADQTKSDIDGLAITTVGTIDTGVWNGTAIATAYIADDAVTGAKIALFDDSLAATTTHFLIADGTDYSSFALSGDVTCTNAGVVSIADDVISSAELADACSAVTSFTAPLIEGSTSVQTPLIEYTDGDDAITIHDGGSISMAKAVFHPIANAAAEPEDATVNIDLRNANYFDVELGANVTDIDFTYGKIGQRFMIRFEQDASSGPYTIAWDAVTMDFDGGGSAVAVTISWPGGTAPTMTATDDKADTYGFVVRAEGHMDGFIIGQNMPVNDN